MKSIDINKGDKVVEKAEDWIYYQPGHEYNEHKERIIRYGTVIAKSQYGVLIKWDEGFIAQEWINYNKFDKNIGYTFYGMKSNTYTRYEKVL